MSSKCLFPFVVCSLIFLFFHQIFSLEAVPFRIPRTAAEFMHAAQTQTAVLLGFAVLSPFAE